MAKPKFGDKEKVKGGVLKRTKRRTRRLISADKLPKGVSPKGGYTGRESRAIRDAAKKLPKNGFNQGVSDRARQRADAMPTIPGMDYSDDRFNRHEARRIRKAWMQAGRPQPYNPLERLSGRSFADELKATLGYEFGDQERELAKEGRRLEQVKADTGTYYDDYRQALADAVSHIRSAADATAASTQTNMDRAAEQDRARLEAQDAEQAAVAARFGRPSTPSQEGQRALEARTFMAQSEQARIRERGDAQTALAEKNVPLALLTKAQELGRANQRIAANAGDMQRLKQKEGEFSTKYRADTRESERQWEAIKKEFKLKEQGSKADIKLKKQELKVEKLKSFNQLKQAMLYAGAKSDMARAIVQQAKKLADAKIISAKQQREIARIYADAKKNAHTTVDNNYSGAGGGNSGRKLQPYERDRVDRAKQALNKVNADGIKVAHNGHGWTAFVRRMRRFGITPQYARIAWEEYWKHQSIRPQTGTKAG